MVEGALILVIALMGTAAHGQGPEAPFVAGFERFARHGSIESSLGGQLLISELSCTACHATESVTLMPKRGPRLTGAGNRLRADWLREFLLSPDKAKPGTTMPDMLASLSEAEREEAVGALVAFLSTQQSPFPETKASGTNPLPHEFWANGDARRGEKLYHLVGCVACHQPDPDYQDGHSPPSAMAALLATLEPEEIEELGLTESARPVPSVPLPDLSAKYTSQALTFFLASPESVRPAARMPNMKLELVEAADIVSYLTKDSPGEKDLPIPAEEPSLVEKGRALFVSLSCANCHEVEGSAPATPAKSLAQISLSPRPGCLGKPTAGLPYFGLDELQIQSITSALGNVTDKEREQPVEDFLEISLLRQNCYACHQRNDRGGIGPDRERYFETVSHVDLGDEGRLPPPLDHVGRKLTLAWISKVLEGSGDIRPHMHVRMPQFPKELAQRLPKALASADQPASLSEAEVFPSLAAPNPADLAEAGRRLLNNGCVQCHPIRGEAVSGAVGVDLAAVTQRVRPQWFLEFLRNPAELKQRTRMPTFFPGGKSAIPEILDGDMDQQIAAMWSYLKDVKSRRLPEKIEEARNQAFELVPHERPIVIRTFMETAGTHAIAVGFPEGVHFAFDAERMRPAQAWRGRFLDAYGTWFVRSAPPATPLGEDVVPLPSGWPLALLSSGNAPWPAETKEVDHYKFLGYRFDTRGIPTFRYRYRDFIVEDRIEPAGDGLRRTLSITTDDEDEAEEPKLWLRAHRGKTLKPNGNAYSDLQGVSVRLGTSHKGAISWRDPDDSEAMEWRVPLGTDRELEVMYQW